MSPPRALFAALSIAALAVTPRGARACINEVYRELTPVEEIAAAERDLTQDRYLSAAMRVRARYPMIRTLDATAPPLALRAQRIFAMALVRADGKLETGERWARWGNLEWALETLRELDVTRADPRSQADLAEAQVRFKRTEAEGVAQLESLDRRDLLGSPYSYLALARARKVASDDGGVRAALRRCVAMSVDRSRCRVEIL